jgi:hypothetical protein
MTPEICPNCGADVPERAKACPECGADEKTGWSDAARYDALGLPDDSFDYEEYAKREFGSKRHRPATGIKPVWRALAALIVAGLLYLLFRGWL